MNIEMKKPATYPRFNFRCNPSLAAKIIAAAAAEERTPSALIRSILSARFQTGGKKVAA